MVNEVKGTSKILSYFAPPKEGDKLSEFEGQVLAIVKEFGVASLADITVKINPNYDTAVVAKSPKWSKIRWGFGTTTIKINMALMKLAQLDCVRIIK